MTKLRKGDVELDLPQRLYKDFNVAVHHIHSYFADHVEIQRLTPTIERSVVDYSCLLATFDLEDKGTHPSFMKDRMVERWNMIQRKDPKAAVGTDTITYMGAFYLIEWHRAAFLHSMFRSKLIRAGINFEHLDDGRLTQTIKFTDQIIANLVFELYSMEEDVLEDSHV